MSDKLTVTITLRDWELEEFNQLCDQQGWPMELMMEQFARWCLNDPEAAEEWLREELVLGC